MIINCPFCNARIDASQSIVWVQCENHCVPVDLALDQNPTRIYSTIYRIERLGCAYTFSWELGKFNLHKAGFGSKYMIEKSDMPLVPPEQSEQLLNRLLKNVAFL